MNILRPVLCLQNNCTVALCPPSLTQLLFRVISSHHTLAYHTIAGLPLTYHWLKFFVFASVYCWSCIVLWVWQVHEWSMIPIWHYAEELHGLKFPQVFPLASLFSSPSPQTLRGLLPVSIVLPFPDFRSFYFCLRGGFVLFYFALLLETGSCYLAQAGLWVFPPQLPSELRVHREAGCGFWFYWTRVPFLAPPLNWEHWSCLAFSICSSSGQLFSPGNRGVSQRSSMHERLQPPKRHPAPRYLREMPERGWEGFTWRGGDARARLGGFTSGGWQSEAGRGLPGGRGCQSEAGRGFAGPLNTEEEKEKFWCREVYIKNHNPGFALPPKAESKNAFVFSGCWQN